MARKNYVHSKLEELKKNKDESYTIPEKLESIYQQALQCLFAF